VAHQGVNGAADQAFDDEAVEAAHYQGVLALGGDEGTFDGLQGHGESRMALKSQCATYSAL